MVCGVRGPRRELGRRDQECRAPRAATRFARRSTPAARSRARGSVDPSAGGRSRLARSSSSSASARSPHARGPRRVGGPQQPGAAVVVRPASAARSARTPPRRPNTPRARRRARRPSASRSATSASGMPDRLGRDATRAGPCPPRRGLGGSAMRRTPVLRRGARNTPQSASSGCRNSTRPVAHRDQAPVLGLFEAPDVESERAARVGDEPEVRAADGGDEQHCPALGVHVAPAAGRTRRSPRAALGAA